MNQAWRLAVLLTVLAASVRAGEDDGDRPRTAQTAEQEEQARRTFVRCLGDGPVYRVEVIYRDPQDGRLYLGQTVLSDRRPRAPAGMPGLGLDEKGRPLPPPDPGRQRVAAAREDSRPAPGAPPWYPPAATTRWLGAWLDAPGATVMYIHVSDLGHRVPLPSAPGAVQVALFHDAAFRVERLTPQQVRDYRPLRQDPDHFHTRLAVLRHELLTAYRELLTKDDRHLGSAAVLLREPFLVDRVRRQCREWVERAGDDLIGFPREALRALGEAGDAADADLLRAWLRRRPAESIRLAGPALRLAGRFGPAAVLPLLTDLLRDAALLPPQGNARRVLDFDPTLPAFTRGDRFLLDLLQQYRASPADFGMSSAPARLLAERLTLSVEDREQVEDAAKNPQPTDWYFARAADRVQGVARAVHWFGDRK